MKGLVKDAPRLERVKVASRLARRHYGSETAVSFDASLGHSEHHKCVSHCIVVCLADAFADSGMYTVESTGRWEWNGISRRLAILVLPTQMC